MDTENQDLHTAYQEVWRVLENREVFDYELLSKYFVQLVRSISLYRIFKAPTELRDLQCEVVDTIHSYTPYRNKYIQLLDRVLRQESRQTDCCHRLNQFFQYLYLYQQKPSYVTSWCPRTADNFRFMVHELFVYTIALMIKHQKFELVDSFLSKEYHIDEQGFHYPDLVEKLKDNAIRHKELFLSRLEPCLSEEDVVLADYLLHLRSLNSDDKPWPMFLADENTIIPLYEKDMSTSLIEKLKGFLHVEGTKEFIKETFKGKIRHWRPMSR
ncbi:hypothetical protein [Algicola sagamiensis]|uniref:hypothetical protein n=1 Tax=Algicola sagamiensis TaxID=163869 RepID=UPI0003828304|nr:hypothetical protein [Algicola sagamiensis]